MSLKSVFQAWRGVPRGRFLSKYVRLVYPFHVCAGVSQPAAPRLGTTFLFWFRYLLGLSRTVHVSVGGDVMGLTPHHVHHHLPHAHSDASSAFRVVCPSPPIHAPAGWSHCAARASFLARPRVGSCGIAHPAHLVTIPADTCLRLGNGSLSLNAPNRVSFTSRMSEAPIRPLVDDEIWYYLPRHDGRYPRPLIVN